MKTKKTVSPKNLSKYIKVVFSTDGTHAYAMMICKLEDWLKYQEKINKVIPIETSFVEEVCGRDVRFDDKDDYLGCFRTTILSIKEANELRRVAKKHFHDNSTDDMKYLNYGEIPLFDECKLSEIMQDCFYRNGQEPSCFSEYNIHCDNCKCF